MSKKTLTIVVIVLALVAGISWYVYQANFIPQTIDSEASSAITIVSETGERRIWGNIASVSAKGVAVSNGEDVLGCEYAPDTSFRTISVGAVTPKIGDIVVTTRDAKTSNVVSVLVRRGVDFVSIQAQNGQTGTPDNVTVEQVVSLPESGFDSAVLDVAGKPEVIEAGVRADLVCKKSSDEKWTAYELSIYE